MSCRASCGHELKPGEVGKALTLRSRSRDWSRCLRHGLLCDACAAQALSEGYVLATDEEQLAWCGGQGPDDQPCW